MKLIKLLVVNQSESEAKEVNFCDGLNILIGQNKTGKSSLIKSIFYTLGCTIPLEKEWLDLITDYYLIFSYDNKEYTIHRKDKAYTILLVSDNKILVNKANYTDFCSEFMLIFNININLLDKNTGDQRPLPPAAIFNYQYIDQDSGWTYKIPNSIENLKYLKDVNNIIKFIVGEHNNRYFRLKFKLDTIKSEITNYKKEIKSITNFISRVESQNSNNKLAFNDNNYLSEQLDKLDSLKKEIFHKEEKVNILLNNITILQQEINYTKNIIKEAEKDYHFSKTLENEIICPTCGTVHKNDLQEKLAIISDIDQSNYLLHSLRTETKNLITEKNEINTQLLSLQSELKILEQEFFKNEENISYVNEIKLTGKNELIKENQMEIKNMEEILGKKLISCTNIQESLDHIESKKRKALITNLIKDKFNLLAKSLDFKSDGIPFRVYKPVLRNSNLGSNGPRAILAYYSALYLYNLDRADYPFKIFVIDTPNQQGQDYKNLEKIDTALKLLTSEKGQVILGSERLTGLEKYSNVVNLMTKYKCLNHDDYSANLDFLGAIFNITSSRVPN